MIRVSVITVCKNAEKVLEKTISSVLKQNNSNYEYIIQDGNSSDNTLFLARAYEDRFKKHNIQYRIETEPDNGIYEGMNKAVDQCKGEWVIFLNAGDTFYDEKVLEYFEKVGAQSGADLAYGHTNYVFSKNKRMIVIRKHRDVLKGMGICQQSIFYKREVLERRKFDTRYRLLADYEYLFYLNRLNSKFVSLNFVVSNYDYNGMSSICCEQTFEERSKIMEHYGIRYKKRRSHFYLRMKQKCIAKLPILNTIQVVHAELNRGE